MEFILEQNTITINGTVHTFDSNKVARSKWETLADCIGGDVVFIDKDAEKQEAELSAKIEASMSEYRICAETGTKITKGMVAGHYSDVYKSMHGIRPRWIKFYEYTMEELGDMLTELQQEAEEHRKEEVIWERKQRKERSRREKRYQKIRKAAKSPFPQATYSLGDVLQGVI